MTIARGEYGEIEFTLRVRRAIHTATPNENAQILTPGDIVLGYWENKGW